MGAFDGYWIPHYGTIPKYVRLQKQGSAEAPKGYYVSRDGTCGGSTGEWRDSKDDADALFDTWVAEGRPNCACWYPPQRVGNVFTKGDRYE
jgi:hypothetical protein